MTSWLFKSTARAGTVIVVTLIVTCLMMTGVIVLRMHRAEQALRHGVARHGLPSVSVLTGTPIATPNLVLGTHAVTVPDAFPSLGDPRPIVLDVVNAWIAGVPDTGHVAPAALEDLSTHAAPDGLLVTGTARIMRPGPTAALVSVPTSQGVLDVNVAVMDGNWSVTGVGWGS
jgi:hypothetical protein